LQVLASYSAPVTTAEIEEVVRFVGLEERIREPVRNYSHGMKQRLGLAQALLPRPDVVLLDEPTEGLDPEGIHDMRRLILKLNREHGTTVLLSSHLLAEVEQLCSRVAILNHGQLIFAGRWSELARNEKRFRFTLDDWEKARVVFQACGATMITADTIELREGTDIAEVIEALARAGAKIRAAEPVRETLEEFYLKQVSAR
jgi:ABC-2 type transport system ATP-binding protein